MGANKPSTTKKYPARTGRPSSSAIDRLRAKIWYCAVKRCGNWSDYKLDMQFGQDDGPITTGGAARNRVFGVIGKKGTLPSRGGHHRRKYNLIVRVEDHQQFKGTAKVIDSPFWDLLKLPPRDLEATSSFAARCMELMGLTRLSGETALDWTWYANEEICRPGRGSLKSTGASTYEACLDDALSGLPCDLNLLALLGGLYREACLSFNPMNAEILGVFFKLSLKQFSSESWLGSHGQYLENLAMNRILYGKSEYFPSDASSVNGEELIPYEIQSQGFIVARDNPRLISFMENCEDISSALKCWMISQMPDEEIDSVDWNEPLSSFERNLIQRVKSGSHSP